MSRRFRIETRKLNRANRIARKKSEVLRPGYVTQEAIDEVVSRVIDELDAMGCCPADGEPRPCISCGIAVETDHDFCVDCRAELANVGGAL